MALHLTHVCLDRDCITENHCGQQGSVTQTGLKTKLGPTASDTCEGLAADRDWSSEVIFSGSDKNLGDMRTLQVGTGEMGSILEKAEATLEVQTKIVLVNII